MFRESPREIGKEEQLWTADRETIADSENEKVVRVIDSFLAKLRLQIDDAKQELSQLFNRLSPEASVNAQRSPFFHDSKKSLGPKSFQAEALQLRATLITAKGKQAQRLLGDTYFALAEELAHIQSEPYDGYQSLNNRYRQLENTLGKMQGIYSEVNSAKIELGQ